MAAALLQSRTLLAALIAELPHALLACDVSGCVTHYNRAAVELFGIPTEDPAALAGSAYPITSQVYLRDGATPVPREDRPLARALRSEEASDVEFVIVPPNGGGANGAFKRAAARGPDRSGPRRCCGGSGHH